MGASSGTCKQVSCIEADVRQLCSAPLQPRLSSAVKGQNFLCVSVCVCGRMLLHRCAHARACLRLHAFATDVCACMRKYSEVSSTFAAPSPLAPCLLLPRPTNARPARIRRSHTHPRKFTPLTRTHRTLHMNPCNAVCVRQWPAGRESRACHPPTPTLSARLSRGFTS